MACVNRHETFMQLALAEARKGLGRTSPNPAVGAVIVRDGTVLGCGFHRKAGTPHAEVNALADARANGHDTRGATMYVTLEPCNHQGRTPPCTQAILAAGITEVFIATRDPNTQVAGGGAGFLGRHGVAVHLDLCGLEGRKLIASFVKHNRSALPWVLMKAGMSLDGKISRQIGQGGAITGPASSAYVHQLRNQLDAILIGVGTALIDDPSLNTRLPEGGEGDSRDPVRVVLDSSLRLPPECRMLRQQSTSRTWIFCGEKADPAKEKALVQAGARVSRVAASDTAGLDLKQVLQHLGQADIASLLVEGGAQVHASFLGKGLVDEVSLLFAPYFIGATGTPLLHGYNCMLPAEPPSLCHTSTERLGSDVLVHGYFTDPDALFPAP